MAQTDTIVARATPPGRGGVGVVRVSGPRSEEIAAAILGRVPEPRRAVFAPFRGNDGEALDEGLALFFRGPASFTGEDVLELQGHGGPIVMDVLVSRCLELGARQARPGEFTERAFLNDKLDLAQAEAVADLIDSGTRLAAQGAMRSLKGEFSNEVNALTEAVTHLRMHVEAAIDFPEEEIDFLSDSVISGSIAAISEDLATLLKKAQGGSLLRDGFSLVLAGAPNAGKSSLMNRLTGRDSAIVTDIPGTTRDAVNEVIQLDGIPINLTDTAGLRETGDVVEAEGVRRAEAALDAADHALLVVDVSAPADIVATAVADMKERLGEGQSFTLVCNKRDLVPDADAIAEVHGGAPVSATTGEGVDALKHRILVAVGGANVDSGTFSARSRHLDALRRAEQAVDDATIRLQEGMGELMAEDLRQAQHALGEITGKVSADDLLGKIFSSFCIGK